MPFEDFQRSANLAVDPATYELENDAISRDGTLDRALRQVADWTGRSLLDIGCGNGYWLPQYAETATSVVGVEPDPELFEAATARVAGHETVEVRHGSAEHLPLADDSVDVAHARFAYFFGIGADAGLREARRVLRPGGVLAAVDNDWGWGEFAEILRMATTGNAAIDPDETHAWWMAHGADRTPVRAAWKATSPAELDRILRLEFPGDVIDEFQRTRRPSAELSYGIAVFTIRT